MAANLIAAFLLFQCISASSIPSSKRAHGNCKSLDIPVFATSDSGIYDVPRVDNDIDTIAWAIYSDTWSTLVGPNVLIKNTTTSGTFNIHAQLCIPKSREMGKDVLQIATHGVHYDSRYWDSELHRENQSYVEAALKAGYAIFTYDRLGVGRSDHPDAYNVVQSPLELEILRQLTLMARNGTLYNFARNAKPSNTAFNKLTKPSKVVHVGHSFGSVLTTAFISKYGPLTDGAIITGYIDNPHLGNAGMASFNARYAATSSPPFHRPSGYVVCQKTGIQTIFFAGNPDTAFTQEMLDYGDAIKQPVPIGEFASAYHIRGLDASSFNAPVQFMLPEFDFYICGGDCRGVPNMDELEKTYHNATAIEVAIQPNTGHALPLHNNATAGFQVTFDFLARNGL
jgi:pimeloyl-ACP methyl ester carboxylesterase